jgi:maleate isomerase
MSEQSLQALRGGGAMTSVVRKAQVTRRIGVLIPATNTVVERELWDLRPPGVDIATARIDVHDNSIGSDRSEQSLVDNILSGVPQALESVMTARPGCVLLAMSAASFRDGVRGLRQLEGELSERAGVPVVGGAQALVESIQEQPRVRRVATITHYRVTNLANVRGFLEQMGYEVIAEASLDCSTAQSIAQVPQGDIVAGLRGLAEHGPDAILQVGTNLRAAHLEPRSEQWLGVPLITINRALLRSGLRRIA